MKPLTRDQGFSQPVLGSQGLELPEPSRIKSWPEMVKEGPFAIPVKRPSSTSFSERLKTSFQKLSHQGRKAKKHFKDMARTLDHLYRAHTIDTGQVRKVNTLFANLTDKELAGLVNFLDTHQLATLILFLDVPLLETRLNPSLAYIGDFEHLSTAFISLEKRALTLPDEEAREILKQVQRFRQFIAPEALAALKHRPIVENLPIYLPLLSADCLEAFCYEVLPQMALPEDIHKIYRYLSIPQKEALLRRLEGYDLHDKRDLHRLLKDHPLPLAVAVRNNRQFERRLMRLLLEEISEEKERTLTCEELWAGLLCLNPHDFKLHCPEDRSFLYEYVDFVLILNKEHPHLHQLLTPSLIKAVQEYELVYGSQHLRNRLVKLAKLIYKVNPCSPQDEVNTCFKGINALREEIERSMDILDNSHPISSQLAHQLIADHDWIPLDHKDGDEIQIDHLAILSTPLLRDLYQDLAKVHRHSKTIHFWRDKLAESCSSAQEEFSYYESTLNELERLLTSLRNGDFIAAASIFSHNRLLQTVGHQSSPVASL